MDNKGFEIALNIHSKILYIRTWGAWDAEFLKKFRATLRGTIVSGNATSSFSWKIRYVLVDLRECSSFILETFRATQMSLLQEVGKLKLQKIAYLEDNAHCQRHLLNLEARRNGAQQLFFTSKEKALNWLWSESSHASFDDSLSSYYRSDKGGKDV